MTDIVNAEATMEETKPLTVATLIASLSTFPPESLLVAGIVGVGLTIPVVGAIVVDSAEGVTLTVLQLHTEGVYNAVRHHQQTAALESQPN